MTLKLKINGRTVEAQTGQTVLEAARAHGLVIPTLCYHKDLSPVGSCRLCVVEVDQWRGQVAACTLPVSEGMNVQTETPALAETRRLILELMLQPHPLPPALPPSPEALFDILRLRSGQALRVHPSGEGPGVRSGEGGEVQAETEFMHWVKRYNAQLPEGVQPQARYSTNSHPNPFIRVDLNKCILCTRCVRACAEVQGRFAWGVGQRGFETRLVAGADTDLLEARCESCGTCAAYCPTGALSDALSFGFGQPDQRVTTTCAYCGVGCQFDLNVKDGKIIRVTSNSEAPVNGMALCVKGRYGYDFVHHPDRLTKPRVRRYLLEGQGKRTGPDRGEWVEVDWDQALDIVTRKLVAIKNESGPDAIGLLASAKCTNEENYLMQKLARQVIGTHNIDHCARLCHASTVAGLAMCFGSGAMSNTMDDVVQHARALFIIGSNTTEQHPVFGAKIRQAVLQRGVKLVVADPRRIDITEFAELHLRQKPGTDVALINGLMHIILQNHWEDREFIAERCEQFEDFRATLEKYTPECVTEITGVPEADLRRAAEILALNKPLAVIWAMGITQHTTGVMNVLSLGNLQMLLGNMGVPGGGVNPLRGQNNVQGACDMGALPNVFPGYQAVTDASVLEKFAQAWKVDGGKTKDEGGRMKAEENFILHPSSFRLSNKPGLTVTEMIPRAGEGKIRALYILGEDPMLSDPDSNHVRECLETCEFIVLQEIFPTETAQFADVLLPGTSFAEKEGTFTNTERRIQRVRQAVPTHGLALPDWLILNDVAQRLLHAEGRTPVGPQARWGKSPAGIMDEIAALTPAYTGVNYARLNRGEQLHWPVKDVHHPGTPILHVGQFTRGKGKFHAVEHIAAKELPDDEYPLMLTTGRVLYHWHGGEMTRRARGLLEVYPESLVEINPEDAARLELDEHQKVRVTSRRGEIVARATITERVPPGLIFANFHFPGEQNANNLTLAELDPIAKIPEYKVCAVKVEVCQSKV